MLQGLRLTATPGGAVELGPLIGAGGQGEVYRARVGTVEKALKWYFPTAASQEQRDIIEALVDMGNDDPRFLWPEAVVVADRLEAGFGYLMPLRPDAFVSLPALFRRRPEARTTTRALLTACIHLTEAYLTLHSRGIAYRDISWGNVFFAPADGRVLVCDNDNAIFEGQRSGVYGTMEFMAPELVRAEAEPGTQTDLHSLAVLLFMMLVNHHPLRGAQELQIRCLDAAAQRRLYGTRPAFLFDPDDTSNGPVKGEHDAVVQAWQALPTSLRDLFVRAFTRGLRDPGGRVRESQWRDRLSETRDAIVLCASCGRQNSYDRKRHRATGAVGSCWHPSCGRTLMLPPTLRVRGREIMLNRDAEVFRHHLDPSARHDFTDPVAVLTEHPQRPGVFGLTNRTKTAWSARRADGSAQLVEPQRTVPLRAGLSILIDGVELEVRAPGAL
jgi:DNA-binding helix-hairpin-helix protein with protein kinase domain